jgi:glycosyltransferase involved in cell wall biosynthesis
MSKMLFIVPMPFHEKSNNAGAKVINYYIKKISLDFDVSVLLCYEKNEVDTKIMLNENPNLNFIYSFKRKYIIEMLIDRLIKKEFYYKLLSRISSKNYKTNGLINKTLTKSLANIEDPDIFDVVIVEFPPLVLQSYLIKNKFPNSKLIASIHDVSFQSLERYLTTNRVWISKIKYFKQFKKNEINNLKNFDLILALSKKDKELIETEIGKTKEILTITPYFDKYEYTIIDKDGIFFFGAMNRLENEKSIIWFVENVWINIKNKSLKLYIIGGGVKKELVDFCLKFDNIVLTGFVADPTPIFNKSFAMIVPLQYGAGIKIKTLEALASGIPLISNSIGIEGIEVNNNKEYLHSETASEWLKSIELISCNPELGNLLSENSKKYMIQNYNLLESYSNYKNKLDILFKK